MSLTTKNSRPITFDDLAKLIAEHKLDEATMVGVGVNADGTLITIREPALRVLNRRTNRKELQIGKKHIYTITDVPTASGGFNISNTFLSAIPGFQNFGASGGNLTFVLGSAGQIWILKSAVVKTDSTAGNRSLFVSGFGAPSSKTVAPSTTGDLLDREIVVGGGKTFSLTNGVAGDSWLASGIRVA